MAKNYAQRANKVRNHASLVSNVMLVQGHQTLSVLSFGLFLLSSSLIKTNIFLGLQT